MNVRSYVISQFENPHGMLGHFVGWLMAIKNNERVKWTIEKLRPGENATLLEVGFGPGVAMDEIASALGSGRIVGIDHSAVMYQRASSRNKRHIDTGKVTLHCGTIRDLDCPRESFDVVYGSNVHFFWPDPVKEFRELLTYLKPGGKLVMIFQPRLRKSGESVDRISALVRDQFEEAGLADIVIDVKEMKPVACIYVCGYRRDPA